METKCYGDEPEPHPVDKRGKIMRRYTVGVAGVTVDHLSSDSEKKVADAGADRQGHMTARIAEIEEILRKANG